MSKYDFVTIDQNKVSNYDTSEDKSGSKYNFIKINPNKKSIYDSTKAVAQKKQLFAEQKFRREQEAIKSHYDNVLRVLSPINSILDQQYTAENNEREKQSLSLSDIDYNASPADVEKQAKAYSDTLHTAAKYGLNENDLLYKKQDEQIRQEKDNAAAAYRKYAGTLDYIDYNSNPLSVESQAKNYARTMQNALAEGGKYGITEEDVLNTGLHGRVNHFLNQEEVLKTKEVIKKFGNGNYFINNPNNFKSQYKPGTAEYYNELADYIITNGKDTSKSTLGQSFYNYNNANNNYYNNLLKKNNNIDYSSLPVAKIEKSETEQEAINQIVNYAKSKEALATNKKFDGMNAGDILAVDAADAGKDFVQGLKEVPKNFAYGTEKTLAGLLSFGEGLGKTLGGGFYTAVGGLGDLFDGDGEQSDFTKWAKDNANMYWNSNLAGEYSNNIDERYNPSDLVKSIGNFNMSAAQMLPAAAIGILSKAAAVPAGLEMLADNLGLITRAASVGGNSTTEAARAGATPQQSLNYGILSGLLEAATGKMFGGIPGMPKGTVSGAIEKAINNPSVYSALSKLVDITGEGAEEAVSTILSPYLKRFTYDKNAPEATNEEVLSSAINGALISAVMKGGASIATKLGYKSIDPFEAAFEKELANEPVQNEPDRLEKDVFEAFEASQKNSVADDGNRGYNEGKVNFYTAPNGMTMSAEYKDWMGINNRDLLFSSTDNVKLKKAIDKLYRLGSIIGDGGTADVIKFERETGLLLSNSGHTQKGLEMARYIQKLINYENLSAADSKIAFEILNKLEESLEDK